MKGKAVSGMLILLLIGVLLFVFDIHPVRAPGTIYIRADGSINPPRVNITTVDNVTYTFTSNINDSIVVERGNIIIDGKGYTVQGLGSGNGFYLSEISNVTVKNTNIKDFGCCIRLESSSNNSIAGNNITAPSNNGIMLLTSSNYNSISGNKMTNNFYGIYLYQSSNNSMSGNNITNNTEGVLLDWSSNYNSISGNNIANSYSGITLNHFSSNNSISGNSIANNNYGIGLLISSGNTICHNNFINNTNHVYNTMDSTWDDGYPYGGNYWSNCNGTDNNQDGIGDSPYVIDENNQDNYPLMGMFSDFEATLEEETYHVITVCNSTVSSFEFDEVNRIIRFNVTGEEGVGFCRVRVPHELMEPPHIVTVDGYTPQYVNHTLYDNGTHRWIYFTYQHSTHKVEIIPEFPSFSILPLFLIATLMIGVYVRKRKKA